MYIVFLALVVIFKFVLTITSALDSKKSKGIAMTDEKRFKFYRNGIVGLWCIAIAVFFMSFIGNIGFADIGFRPISFSQNIWFTVITLILSGLLLIFCLYRIIAPFLIKNYREKIKKDIAGVEGDILPRTKKERRLFALVSFSAGTCEEIFYRGFVAFLLQAVFPGIPIFLIVLIPSVLFGIAHTYQGLQGVISTGIVGAFFMCVFLVTGGSLILPMVLHFLLDFSSTFLLSEE